MTSNYEAIRKGNEEDYGKAIGRFAPGLLVDRYDDRHTSYTNFSRTPKMPCVDASVEAGLTR